MLAPLKDRVDGRIVVNAVLLSSKNKAVVGMNKLGISKEAMCRSAARMTWQAASCSPIDLVFIIVGGLN